MKTISIIALLSTFAFAEITCLRVYGKDYLYSDDARKIGAAINSDFCTASFKRRVFTKTGKPIKVLTKSKFASEGEYWDAARDVTSVSK